MAKSQKDSNLDFNGQAGGVNYKGSNYTTQSKTPVANAGKGPAVGNKSSLTKGQKCPPAKA
jgi:hypothetical protein